VAEKKLTIRVDANTAGLSRGMKQASAQVNTFGSSIQKGITRHAAGIRRTGMALAGLGAAVTGMAVVSIKAAVDFERELANVSTMLDDVSMKFMPEYEASLRNMAKEFGQSTKTLSKGLYDILSASIPPAKALDVLAVSARAAVAGLSETGITADAITTILNSYGFAAEDAGQVSDKLWAIIKKGKTTMVELAPSIGKVAAVAATAGLSFDELGATLATITRGGVKTDVAMTNVKAIMLAFLKPTDDAAKAAKEFGLELSSNTLRSEGLRGVIKLLTNATAEQLATILPNVRGLTGMAIALKDTTGWAESYEAMLNSAGLTEEMFQKQTGALAFTFDQLKQEFADVFRVIGKELIPIIKTEFVPLIREVIEHVKVWIERFKGLSPSVKKFLLLLGPLLIALGGFLMILPSLAVAIGVLLGPVGLIIAAIAGLTAAFIYFYKTNEGFRNFINKIGSGLQFMVNNWKATWKAIRQMSIATFEQMKKTIFKFFTDWSAFKAGLNLFAQFGKSLVMVWLKTWKMIGTVLVRVLSIVWAPLIKSLQWVADNIKYYFALGIEKARNAIIEGINWITSKVFTPMANFFIDVANKMSEGVQTFVNFFIRGMNTVTKAIKPVVDALGWFAKHILRIELPEGLKEFGEIAEVEFKKIEKLGKDALTIEIPESTLKQPEKFAARMDEAWAIIKDQYSKIPGDLKKYVDDLVAEWENVSKAAGEFGEIIDWADYAKKLGEIIKKLKAAGVNTTALEKEQEKLNKAINYASRSWAEFGQLYNRMTNAMKKGTEATEEQSEALKKLIASEYYRGMQEWGKRQQEQLDREKAHIQAIKDKKKKYDELVASEYYRGMTERLKREQEQLDREKAHIQAIKDKKKKYDELVDSEYYRGLKEQLKREQEQLDREKAHAKAIADKKKKYDELVASEYYRGMVEQLKREQEQLDREKAHAKAIADKKKKYDELVDSEYYRGLKEQLKREQEQLDREKAHAKAIADKKKKYDELVASEYYRGLTEQIKRQQEQLDREKAHNAAIADKKKKYDELVASEYYRGMTERLKREQEQLDREKAHNAAIADKKKKYDELVASEYYRGMQEWGKRQQEQLDREKAHVEVIKSLQEAWNEYYQFLEIENINSIEDFAAYWESLTDKEKQHLKDSYDAWEQHREDLNRIWRGFTRDMKSATADLIKDLITGIEGGKEAWKNLWQSFGDVIVNAFRDAFAKSLVEKLGFDKIFEGNILNWGNLFGGLGKLIVGVFKGVGNVIGSIFGIGGAATQAVVTGSTVAAEALKGTTAQMGIMTKIGLGLQSVVTGIGGALKYFATMGSTATTALGALGAGLVGVVGFVGTAVAAWTGFSYLAENVIGPVLSGIREGLTDFLGISGSVNDSIEGMTNWLSLLGQKFADVGTAMQVEPQVLESYKNQLIGITKDVATGVRQIGDLSQEESIAWLHDAITNMEGITEAYRAQLLGILEASTVSVEEIEKRALEAGRTYYDEMNALYQQTQNLIERGHNATADRIAQAVVATEDAIQKSTGAARKAFEQQLWDLQHLQNYGTDAYWLLYKQAKASFEETTHAADESAQAMSLSTRTAADEMLGAMRAGTTGMSRSFEAFVGSVIKNIGRIPREVDFKVRGYYSAPKIPSYQHGGVIEPGELVLSRPITNWIRQAMSSPGPMSHTPTTNPITQTSGGGNPERATRIVEQNITIQSLFPPDDPDLYDQIVRIGLKAAMDREEGRRTS